MQAHSETLPERLRTRSLLVTATIVGGLLLLVLVAIADKSPAVFSPGAANRLDLWVIMIVWILGPFGIPAGLLAGWFAYANEHYQQARLWLLLPVIWGALCIAADLAAVHFGPWPLG
ncbi:MAG: hypothetical protein KGN76_00955 [Acidobacteriota bacterium]|nr:hypothetical protein [Acidobacteriota bacterium]